MVPLMMVLPSTTTRQLLPLPLHPPASPRIFTIAKRAKFTSPAFSTLCPWTMGILHFLPYDLDQLWSDAFEQSSFQGSSFTPYSVINLAIHCVLTKQTYLFCQHRYVVRIHSYRQHLSSSCDWYIACRTTNGIFRQGVAYCITRMKHRFMSSIEGGY